MTTKDVLKQEHPTRSTKVPQDTHKLSERFLDPNTPIGSKFLQNLECAVLMRKFLLSEKESGSNDYAPVCSQEMERLAKLKADFQKAQIAEAHAIKLENEKKQAALDEERRKQEELALENIPDDGELSSPVDGKSVRKLSGPKLSVKAPLVTAPNSKSSSQRSARTQTHTAQPQPKPQPKPPDRQALKRKAEEMEMTEKLQRVSEQMRNEQIQLRKKELGYLPKPAPQVVEKPVKKLKQY